MFDTHAHLTNEFFNNIEEIVDSSKSFGLTGILSCSTRQENFNDNLELGHKYKNFIYPTIGIHPENAHEFSINYDKNIKFLRQFSVENRSNIFGIGECGIDYYHSTEYENEQKRIFEEQIKLSLDLDLPLIIHTRNSKDPKYQSCILDGVQILKKYPGSKGVCHCFSGNLEEANNILDIGFFIGFTNIVTYKNSSSLKEVAEYAIKNYPNQILFETDAPYLPPSNNRGGKCFPIDVKNVYELFDNLISKKQISSNIYNLFKI